MNERIKELAEQAWIADGTERNSKYKKSIVTEHLLQDMEGIFEKYAELLIRECAVWMENATVTDSAGNKDHIGDSFFWADELKKHFGVK